MIEKIVSGGQSGVDRAALDAARRAGLACGGWCPRGRRAEDGPIPARYPLRETQSAEVAARTRLNVRDSQGTLVLARGPAAGGTALAADCARALRRPLLVVDLGAGGGEDGDDARIGRILAWVREHRLRVVNVAGPRESECPGIGAAAGRLLARLFRVLAADDGGDGPLTR